MNHNEIKARLLKAENAEEVVAIAKEAGVELNAEQAEKLFGEVLARRAAAEAPQKLDEDELAAVAGGGELPICKGSIKVDGVTEGPGRQIVSIWSPEWCWGGPDYCYKWTETYDGINVYGV